MRLPCHWAKPSVSSLLILSKHLPAFPGLSFIFLFIVPGFLYGKLGTSSHSKKHLRLTNKQTDGPKDNKACGQTLRWLGSTHWLLCPLSLSRNSLPYNAGKADSLWKELVTGQWSQHLFPNSRCKVHVIYDPFIWNPIQLTHIMVNQLHCPLHILEACGGPGCERTLWRIVQSFHWAVWSDHSSQPGWCLACSVHSEKKRGGLWRNLVFV